MVLLILVMLLLGTPLALLAAGETAVSPHTPSFSQTAVRTVLPYFVGPDCDDPEETNRSEIFDLTQPMPSCWLVPDQTVKRY